MGESLASLVVAAGMSALPAPVPAAPAVPAEAAAFMLALQDPAFEDVEKAARYRQTRRMRHDPDGDVALLALVKTVHANLVSVLLGGKGTRIDRAPNPLEKLNPVLPGRNEGLVIEGRKNPIKRDKFLAMLSQVLLEGERAGLPPRYGEIHEWSPEFDKAYAGRLGNHGYTMFTKLLIALSAGLTYRFMPTERELPLAEYILSRPDGAVTLHELFRASYWLNEGDVYLTLLTIENILAESWRAPERESLAITRKLAPITNNYEDRGDKYGAWYHLFGIMTYGYATNEWRAGRVAFIESQGSMVLSKGAPEMQEYFINKEGAALGAGLQKLVKERLYRKADRSRSLQDEREYLDLGEDYRDRLPLTPSPDIGLSYWHQELTVWSRERDYLDCKVEVMRDLGAGVDSTTTMTWDGQERLSFRKGRGTRLYDFHERERRIRGFRVFISGCRDGASAAAAASF